MNKWFKIFYIFLVLSLSSCLDETPKDQMPESVFTTLLTACMSTPLLRSTIMWEHMRRARAYKAHAVAYTTTTP